MKKVFFISLLVLVVMCASVISFCNVTYASDKPIKLLFAFMEPPMGPVSKIIKKWSKDLEQRTQGRVKVDLALGGVLGKMGEHIMMTSQSVCDAAACLPAWGDPGQFPMSEMFELPFNIPSGEVASKAMTKWVEKGYLDKELSEVKLMSVFGAPSDIFFTTKKPLTTLTDLKGLKLWNTMPGKVELIKRVGSIPVSLSPSDLYSGLHKGVIDGAFFNYMFLFIYNVAPLVKHSTAGMPAGTVLITTIMNKKKFNSLPADIREIIDGMTDDYSIEYGASLDTSYGYGKKAFVKMGGKEINWTPEELAKVNKLVSPLWDKWIEDKEKRGLPARKAINDFYNMLKEVGVENPAIGYKAN